LKSVRQYCPKAKVLYYPHDLHYIRLERESFLTGRKDLLILSKEMRAIELANSESCDGTIVVSSTELEVLSAELPESRIFHLPLISSSRTKYLPKFGCLNLVFVGNFNHTPNEDAVIWFIDDILPVVKDSLPEIKFYIVGGNPPATITARCSEFIITTDYIDDLDDFFTGMNLSVVPLRFGAGMKGKVLASMRCGLPVVTTSIGCEGMGLKHKKDILISDTVQDFANSIIRVLTERPLWETLSENSIKISEMKWGRAQTISTLKNILMDAGLPVEDDKNLDFFPLYPFS
jgi:glycosyltransferase involved in cell wall biosynthesis